MADEKPEAPKPAPAPKKPKVSVAEQARADIAKGQVGFHPARPLHYARAFIHGTIHGTLGNLAKWARFGLKWGLIGGVALAIGFPAMQLVVTGPAIAAAATTLAPLLALGPIGVIGAMVIGATLAGAALGGTHGLLTGGRREMMREVRRDRYAEDLVQRAKVRKAAPANRADYRPSAREKQVRDDFAAYYALDFEQRERKDLNTYWQDKEAARGFGSMGR